MTVPIEPHRFRNLLLPVIRHDGGSWPTEHDSGALAEDDSVRVMRLMHQSLLLVISGITLEFIDSCILDPLLILRVPRLLDQKILNDAIVVQVDLSIGTAQDDSLCRLLDGHKCLLMIFFA